MPFTLKSKIGIGVLIIAGLNILLTGLLYKPGDAFGGFYLLAAAWITAGYIGSGAAALLFLLRLCRLVKPKSLTYLTVGIFNAVNGALAIILFFLHRVNQQVLHVFLISLLAAVILLGDAVVDSMDK